CQPFAKLIVDGKKTTELRPRNTNFRGEFLIHAAIKVRKEDCKRLKINPNKLVTGAIIGKAEIFDVIKYNSKSELRKDSKKHHASKNFQDKSYGYLLKNAKRFRIPIPYKGKLGFFDVKLPKTKIKTRELRTDIIDEEYRYQWVGRH
ncbi:MAG: ASCH domain-containing protein, partial [Nitrosopumilaceae archaeon]